MWWTLGLAGTAKLLVVGHLVRMRCGAQKSDRYSQWCSLEKQTSTGQVSNRYIEKKKRVGVVLRLAAGRTLSLLLLCDSPEELCDLCFRNINEEIQTEWEDRKGC